MSHCKISDYNSLNKTDLNKNININYTNQPIYF
jgi:hypothetical protein